VAYSATFLSFVHDFRGTRVIGGFIFGCGGAALGNPRLRTLTCSFLARIVPSQNQWTVAESGCSVSRMWKSFAALLLIVTPALADEYPTAYEALRAVGAKFNRASIDRVISVTGVDGTPQPETWKVLIEDPRSRSGVREIEVANGQVSSERTPLRSVAGSTEGATIKTTRLNLDSSGAFAVASHTADKSNARFATVSYTLRTDEHGDPIWIVTLQNKSSRPVGTIYIGANRGNVRRTEGMFAGATMEDVETDREIEREPENDHGIVGNAKSSIRNAFRRAQDEATGMFNRVRRSFADFISPD
jgi:hypothetical protein